MWAYRRAQAAPSLNQAASIGGILQGGLLWRDYVTRSKIHRDDCALRLRDCLLASEAVIGVIGLTRTRERGDGGLHRQPPLAEVRLGARDRVKRRLSMEQGYGHLRRGSSSPDARLKLGANFHPHPIDVADAGTRAARRCPKRERRCPHRQKSMNAHVLCLSKSGWSSLLSCDRSRH
jgi:hypothetical protein